MFTEPLRECHFRPLILTHLDKIICERNESAVTISNDLLEAAVVISKAVLQVANGDRTHFLLLGAPLL